MFLSSPAIFPIPWASTIDMIDSRYVGGSESQGYIPKDKIQLICLYYGTTVIRIKQILPIEVFVRLLLSVWAVLGNKGRAEEQWALATL